MNMKTFSSVRLTSYLLALLLTAQPAVYAQKLSRKALRALRAQEAAEIKKMADLAAEASSSNAAFRALQGTTLAEIHAASRFSRNAGDPRSKKSRQRFFENQGKLVSAEEIRQAVHISVPAAAHGKKKRLPFDPLKKVHQLVKSEKNPLKALRALHQLEDNHKGYFFFSLFASSYYGNHFSVLTPHLKELFKKIESLHNHALEVRVVKRMRFLADNRDYFRAAFAPNIPKQGMRIRYTKDIAKLTPDGFNSRNLVFSFERKMNPGQNNASIRHINAHSTFPVGKDKVFPIYQYNGPYEYLPLLYRYLLNGNHPKKELTVILDKKAKAMAIYNEDKTLWLRITPHEYSFPERLHLHLNEIRTAEIETLLGLVQEETVNFNLSIPLAPPANLPSHNRSEFLYNEMILKPVQHFKGNARIKIIERDIF